MARTKIKRKGLDWKGLLGEEKEFFKSAVQEVVHEARSGHRLDDGDGPLGHGQPGGAPNARVRRRRAASRSPPRLRLTGP